MNPTKTPRGVEHGRGGGCRTTKDRRRDYERERRTPPSTISDTSTKRAKFKETNSDEEDLFLMTDKDS
jgi:hypothetical protein